MIPKRLIRTAPDETTLEMDRLWTAARNLHPTWYDIDIRNTADPKKYPLTSPYWGDCQTGAQAADLKRFEELWWRGGVYIDSDVEVLKPFDALLGLEAFAGYEDTQHVCIAVMGFTPGHPALKDAIELAIQRRHLDTWQAGMGSFQDAISGRTITLFPPGMFYPVHWREQMPPYEQIKKENPWAWTIHYWAKSWLSEQKAEN